MAQGGVFFLREDYKSLCAKIIAMLPEFEARAPWKHKKEVDMKNIPKLRFVDVITWSGFYDVFPSIVLAESLPNEKEFKDKFGSVNLVFANIWEALESEGR